MRPGRGTGGHHRGRLARAVTWAVVALSVTAVCTLILAPSADGAARFAARLVDAARTISRHAPKARPSALDGRLFAGLPTVGALFRVSDGKLGQHFCSASVVDSPVKDLLVTAAHCVSRTPPADIAYVPAYHNGQAPYGVWQVTRVVVGTAWQSSADPNDDIAFLVVRQPGEQAPIQDVTGGNKLGIGWSAREWARVIGYPETSGRPVSCAAWTHPFLATQMRFDCGGYTDGTSGGPFLVHMNPATGDGTVIGVIGGYEQGGNIAAVSYSARFGPAVWALYTTAVAQGGLPRG